MLTGCACGIKWQLTDTAHSNLLMSGCTLSSDTAFCTLHQNSSANQLPAETDIAVAPQISTGPFDEDGNLTPISFPPFSSNFQSKLGTLHVIHSFCTQHQNSSARKITYNNRWCFAVKLSHARGHLHENRQNVPSLHNH